jgi:fructoselysine-6-P-deglycase FrlB-like protein
VTPAQPTGLSGPVDGWALTHGDVFTTDVALAAAFAAFGEQRADLARLLSRPPTEVTLTGCGSALSVASVVAPYLQAWARVPARAVASSDLLFNSDRVGPTSADPLLVAFSRTGRTTETILAATSFAARFPGRVVVLTCSTDEPLSAVAAVAVEAVGARDSALPQTRSYAAMLLLGLKLATIVGGAVAAAESAALDRAGQVVESALAAHAAAALAQGTESKASTLLFLGSGPLAGLAREGAIKAIEMSLTPADAMPFLEVRHGPNALVGPDVSVVGLVSPGPAAAELQVLRDVASQGAETTALVPASVDAAATLFHAPPGLPEVLLPFAYLPVIQLLALGRAKAAGTDPNEPPHVRHHVEVDDLYALLTADSQ